MRLEFILIFVLVFGMSGVFASEPIKNDISGFELEIELPHSAGEDFGVYANKNEASNLVKLRNFVLNSNEPIKTLKIIRAEMSEGTNIASKNLDTVPRWTPDGIETLEYGIYWTHLRANNDVGSIASQVLDIMNDGMSLESAFAVFNYILERENPKSEPTQVPESKPTNKATNNNFEIKSSLDKISVSNPRLVNTVSQNIISDVLVGQKVEITTDLQNNNSEDEQPFIYLVQIKNENNSIISISWISGSLAPFQSYAPSMAFKPEFSGNYTVEILILESIENINPLAHPTIFNFKVIGEEDSFPSIKSPALLVPIPEPIPEPKREGIVSVFTNKHSYNWNESLHISGTVPSEHNSEMIVIRIVDASHRIVYFSQKPINSEGEFSDSLTTYGTLWKNPGIFEILVSTENRHIGKTTALFTGVDLSNPDPSEPLDPKDLEIKELKEKNLELRLENKELKIKITTLHETVRILEEQFAKSNEVVLEQLSVILDIVKQLKNE